MNLHSKEIRVNQLEIGLFRNSLKEKVYNSNNYKLLISKRTFISNLHVKYNIKEKKKKKKKKVKQNPDFLYTDSFYKRQKSYSVLIWLKLNPVIQAILP